MRGANGSCRVNSYLATFYAALIQLVEYVLAKHDVAGSNPARRSNLRSQDQSAFRALRLSNRQRRGRKLTVAPKRDWYSGCAGAFQASEGRSFLPSRSRHSKYSLLRRQVVKISEILFEGPYHHDSDVPSIKMDHLSISDASLARDYFHLAKLEGTDFDFWLSKTKKAAMITTPTKDTIGKDRNLIVVDLHFLNRAGLPVKNELQVHTVLTSPEYRGRGLAMALYVVLCRYDYTVVSDFEQFNGGKALWKKMAAEAEARKFVIRVWSDANSDWVRNAGGEPLVYNADNLEEDAVWQDFKSHMEPTTLLVLSST